jgi:dTDP-4-amino-4,6-dideoxygalactose transaminase
VFSLYPTKAMPAGEGGLIVTHDAAYAERLREFRSYGKYVENGVIRYRATGFNFRMDEWTAAICYFQMQRRQEILELRQACADRLKRIIRPMLSADPGFTNWYKYPVRRSEANGMGITRMTGKIYSRADQLRTALGLKHTLLPLANSEWVADNHVCIPLDENLYADMSDDQILAYLRGQ